MDTGTNLNELSHSMILAMIEAVKSQYNLDSILVDMVGPSPKLAAKIAKVA
jgi:hypothetical protein